MATRNPQQTRDTLLTTAFADIHAHGFQGMRVDEVLRLSGLKKGAFYHHFGSKLELGYAVLEEQVKPLIEKVWLAPLEDICDPITQIPKMIDSVSLRVTPAMLDYGCPLNNLAQEMTTQDAGFQTRIVALYAIWIEALAEVFERGKQAGLVRNDVDSHVTARFIIAVLQGCVGIYKVERTSDQWAACRSQIAVYLQTLKAVS